MLGLPRQAKDKCVYTLFLKAVSIECVVNVQDNATFFDAATGKNTTMLHCDSATDPTGNVNCTATDITVVGSGEAWPAKAQAIIDAAGPK